MKRPNRITAAMLYDLVQCPHRAAMDLFGDPAKRDEINPFVELFWHEADIDLQAEHVGFEG